jgi:hypothetical protein
VDNLDAALTAADGDIVVVPIATLQEALDYLRALAPIPELVASSK